jgi:hypothetical protein
MSSGASMVDCNERVRLLGEYSDALADASMASAALTSLAGKSALSAYLVLLRELERTELVASNARAVYEQHIIEHGCTSAKDPA